jgi:hypothetical protein
MTRSVGLLIALLVVGLGLPFAMPAQGQASPADGWRAPSAEMPAMPRTAELRGEWAQSLGSWFRGVDRISGVETGRLVAQGEPASEERPRFVRFSSGPVPVVNWSDRNGDGRADLIEIYRNGVVVLQVVDADFNGRANVVRYLDSRGALVREERI